MLFIRYTLKVIVIYKQFVKNSKANFLYLGIFIFFVNNAISTIIYIFTIE